jgi:hypothetical protein
MKARDLKLIQKPPVTFALGPKCFSSRWSGRPTEVVHMGLRLASAEEHLRSATDATLRVDRLLSDPRVSKYEHDDERWMAVYEVCRIHFLLGRVMTSPADVNAPFWAQQDGSVLIRDNESTDPSDPPIVSMRFTDHGIARILDEYEALVISSSPVWPPSDDEELGKLGVRLAAGSFLSDLTIAAKEGNAEAGHIEAQIRRLFHRIIHLRSHGREAPSAV